MLTRNHMDAISGVNKDSIKQICFYNDGAMSNDFNFSTLMKDAEDCVVIGKDFTVDISEENRVLYFEAVDPAFVLSEELINAGWNISDLGYPTPCHDFE